jgi:uncharacterized membrane protein
VDIGLLLATWLHTLAFVIVMGYYGVLGRMLLPALERSLDGRQAARAVGALARRARPLLVASVVLFVATGSWLVLVAEQYAGLGNVTASTWTVLMLVKHVVIVVLVALAVLADRAAFVAADAADAADVRAARHAMRRLGLLAEGATACGALAILLTVAAQLQ